MVFSILSLFPFGAFSTETTIEKNAGYIADIAKKNPDADYINILVESNGEATMPAPSIDFYALYGIFNISENKCTFAGTGNAEKEHTLTIDEIPDCENLSILYAEANSNKEYKGHYKHDYYPLELMFKGATVKYNDAYSFCYISESQANRLLDEKGLQHTKENYESLIGKENITFTCDDSDSRLYTIGNIFYETNYFYDGLRNVMGDFVMMSTSFPTGIKKQASFFLNKYSFQNKHYMNYICARFNSKDYSTKINQYNLSSSINESSAVNFFYLNSSANVVSWMFAAVAIILFVLSIYIFWRAFEPRKPSNYIPFFIILFTPYLLFKYLFLITKNISLFSYLSSVSNVAIIVIYSILFIVFLLNSIKQGKRTKERYAKGGFYEEITV